MIRRPLATVTAVVALAACHVDVTTSVQVAADGSGTVTVHAVADAEIVDAAPGLADDLRLEDLAAAGWSVEGPSATDDGGLEVTLAHTFTGPDEANELLAGLNGKHGPFRGLAVTRLVDDDSVTIVVDGSLGVDDGVAALADDGLVSAVGGVPWQDEMATRDLSLDDVLSARLVVALPDPAGRTTAASAPAAAGDDGAAVFDMPTDGDVIPVGVRTVIDTSPSPRSTTLAVVAGVALLAWLVVSIAFVVYVLQARKRRAVARLRRM